MSSPRGRRRRCGRGLPRSMRPSMRSVGDGWLMESLGGGFVGLLLGDDGGMWARCGRVLAGLSPRLRVVNQTVDVSRETLLSRYGALHQPALYLVRPDQHIAARWREVSPEQVGAALDRATGKLL